MVLILRILFIILYIIHLHDELRHKKTFEPNIQRFSSYFTRIKYLKKYIKNIEST